MRIAIIGGGFTALAAGIDLVDGGNEVTILEAEKKLGGLAVGFGPADSASRPTWDWSLERYYHHIFANDKAIMDIAEKVGLPAYFTVPKTNSLINGKQVQLDSPLSLLMFSEISIAARLRMGLGLMFLKLIGNGLKLEQWRAVDLLPKLVGKEGYQKVWRPLLAAKFGPYLNEVNMAWFWARVYKRTQSLGYFEGGFSSLAEKMSEYMTKRGGRIKLGTKVRFLRQEKGGGWWLDGEKFDRVLVTTPAPITDKLIGKGVIKWPKISYLWAQTVALELDRSLMKGYWLNILEKDWPFLVAVEHTNFVDKKHYGGKTVLYLSNYLAEGDKRLKMPEEKLLKLFLPYLKKINPEYGEEWLKRSWCFEAAFAQPVFPINYDKQIPSSKTNKSGLYVANMSMVYPWDRGTNYAVELGQKTAKLISQEND